MIHQVEASDKRLRNSLFDWVGIIVHHTGIPKNAPTTKEGWHRYYKAIVNWLSVKDDSYVSAHYVISREGMITQLVNPKTHIAYHAGASSFWHPIERKWVSHCNNYFIGIELIGDGNLIPYTDIQYQALAGLCREMMDTYPTINPNLIVGHDMVSPERKVDPGVRFDWKKLFEEIYKYVNIS